MTFIFDLPSGKTSPAEKGLSRKKETGLRHRDERPEKSRSAFDPWVYHQPNRIVIDVICFFSASSLNLCITAPERHVHNSPTPRRLFFIILTVSFHRASDSAATGTLRTDNFEKHTDLI